MVDRRIIWVGLMHLMKLSFHQFLNNSEKKRFKLFVNYVNINYRYDESNFVKRFYDKQLNTHAHMLLTGFIFYAYFWSG